MANRTGSLEDVLAVSAGGTRAHGARTARRVAGRTSSARGYATVGWRSASRRSPRLAWPNQRQHAAARIRGRHGDQSLLNFALFAIEVGPTLLVWALILALPARYVLHRWRREMAERAG